MELTGGVEPIGLHYTLDGEDYLVADIFASVAPITPLAPGGGDRLTDTFNSTPAATAAAAIERTELDAHNVLSLASPGRVRLEVYAITGQRVKLAVDGEFGIGRHPLSWDGRDEAGRRMPSGVYFYRVSAPGLHRVKKVSMLR